MGGDSLKNELHNVFVQMYYANCGTKVAGLKSQDGALRITCQKCGIKIYSKQKNAREVDIKLKSVN